MAKIIVKTQAELNKLPDRFEEFTYIYIEATERIVVSKARENSSVVARGNSSVEARGNSSVEAWGNSSVEAWENSSVVARGNSSVEAWENSSVVAWGNSSVVAWENSSVEARGNSSVVAWGTSTVHLFYFSTVVAYLFATIYVKSTSAKIKKLYDKSTAKFCVEYSAKQIEDKHSSAQVVKAQKELDFETYLERGYVKADGIFQKLVSKKKVGSIQVFEVANFGRPNSFVIKKGEVFSHGKTVEEAKADLKYKISTRDTSEFKKWKLNDKKSTDDLIRAYRAITGACEFGTKHFCEQQAELKPKYKVSEIITMTKGQFGSQQFEEFFK